MSGVAPERPGVVAVGSPMWDTMAGVDKSFLASQGLPLGDATPLSGAALGELWAAAASVSQRPPVSGCGGCASNTAKVLARLGCDAALCGAIGADEVAGVFRQGLEAQDVEELLVSRRRGGPQAETGKVLCLVTPGGERTFAYTAGASASLTGAEVSAALELYASSRALALVYFDVYTLLCPGEVPEIGMRKAHALDAKVALNLGSSGIVSAQRERLWSLLRGNLINVITLNEAEANALCGFAEQQQSGEPAEDLSQSDTQCREACTRLAEHCDLVLITLGSRGFWVSCGREAVPTLHTVESMEGAVDSTGAGDFFAGGFVAAWLRGLPLESCAHWGTTAARRVLCVFGTDLGEFGWQALRHECVVPE